MSSHIPSVAWRRKFCNHSTAFSAASFRHLCITSIRKSNEPRSARSARTQNTTEELARLFDQSDQLEKEDVRKPTNSLPNAPFQHLQGQTDPQNISSQLGYSRLNNDLTRLPVDLSQFKGRLPAHLRPKGVPVHYENGRRIWPDARKKSGTQSFPQTQQNNSGNTRYGNSRRLPVDPELSSEEAQPPPQTQQTNKPLIKYDYSRESSQPTSQRSSTRPSRPIPTGAIDARSLGASQGPNRLAQRYPPRVTDPTRSPGAASRMGRFGTTDPARQKLPSAPAPRHRDRRAGARTATTSERPNIFGSGSKDKTPMSPEEVKYKREKEEAKKPKAVTFVPAAVDLESLSGTGPVLPLGAWGQEEAVADWVEGMEARSNLVWGKGGIRVDRVEGFRGAEADDTEEGLQKVEVEVKTGSENAGQAEELLKKEFETRKIAERLFKGEYVFDGKEEKGVLGGLKRQAVRNGSYIPKDYETLTRKVKSLLPAEQSEKGRKTARV